MRRPLVSETEVSPAVVLSRLTGWSTDYRADPCPAAVADVLVSFAFLVGLQAGSRRPEAVHSLLCRVSREQPSAYQRSADVARGLFEPEAAQTC
ncbi:MAG TPA: hypothetical protein VFP63_02295 [Dehalococcoidia bacterium]|nr:hypothetical protein [Dehalococcoidia bacterium]